MSKIHKRLIEGIYVSAESLFFTSLSVGDLKLLVIVYCKDKAMTVMPALFVIRYEIRLLSAVKIGHGLQRISIIYFLSFVYASLNVNTSSRLVF